MHIDSKIIKKENIFYLIKITHTRSNAHIRQGKVLKEII